MRAWLGSPLNDDAKASSGMAEPIEPHDTHPEGEQTQPGSQPTAPLPSMQPPQFIQSDSVQPPQAVQQPPAYAPGAAQSAAPPLPPRKPANPAVAAYISGVFRSSGLQTLAWIAGGVLAAGLVGIALLLLGFAFDAVGASSSSSSDLGGLGDITGDLPSFGDLASGFGQFIGLLLVALGMMYGGGLSLKVDADLGMFGGDSSAGGALQVLPLGALALVVLATALIARIRLSRERVLAPTLLSELTRAGIEGAIVALLMTFITGFAKLGMGEDGFGFSIRTQAGLVFLTLFFTVGITLFVSRWSLRRRLTQAQPNRWWNLVREGGGYLAVLGVVFGATAVIGLIVMAIKAKSVTLAFFGLLLLGNVTGVAAELGHLGGVSMSLSEYGSETMTVFDAPWWLALLLIVIAVITLAVSAAFIGVRRARTRAADWGRTWQLPLIAFVVWGALSLGLLGVQLRGELPSIVDVIGTATIGASWWVPFGMAIAAFIVSAAAEFVPGIVYGMSPALLALIGGKQQTGRWLHGEAPQDPAPSAAPMASAAPLMAPTAPLASAAPAPAPTEAPADGAYPPLPEPQKMSKKAKAGLIAALSSAGAVIVLIVAGVVTVNVINSHRDPAGQVEEYLSLLADGKADQATKMVDPGLKTGDRELLTDEALGSAEQRIEVNDVETTSKSDDAAIVKATYSLDGERFEQQFELSAGDPEYLVLDTWKLDDALVQQVMLGGQNVEALQVGDTEVKLDADEYGSGSGNRELYVYPGLYTVTGVANEFLDSSTAELRAAGPDSSEGGAVDITAAPNASFEKSVLKQVKRRFAQCTEVPTNMDAECPYATRDDDLDALKVVDQPSGFESIDLTSFTTSEGTIAVRANPSSWDKHPDLEESTVSAYGAIEFVEGKPKVTKINIW